MSLGNGVRWRGLAVGLVGRETWAGFPVASRLFVLFCSALMPLLSLLQASVDLLYLTVKIVGGQPAVWFMPMPMPWCGISCD